MTSLRLLPWPGPEGQRAYLSTDDTDGFMSRLADRLEAAQLDTGAEVLAHVAKLVADPDASAVELRYAVMRLSECLTDALRVAESRGARLPVSGEDDGGRA